MQKRLELLKYPKDSAGSIMTVEYVDLKKDISEFRQLNEDVKNAQKAIK